MTKPPIALAEALALIQAQIRPLPTETVAPRDALGRGLARPVVAAKAQPSADNSAMDGYAVRSADLGPDGGALTQVGAAFAGSPWGQTLEAGTTIRITTGALIPAGADAVIPQELSRVSGTQIHFQKQPAPGDHIRRRGEEYNEGDVLVPAGATVGPATLGLVASARVLSLVVHRRPRVALIITGDELVTPELAGDEPHRSVDVNTPLLEASLAALGLTVSYHARVGDDPSEVAKILETAKEHADLIISTGGASVGPTDPLAEAWESHGIATIFWKVAIKPGKPVRFGVWPDGTPIFGLPGNPLAALTGFEWFITPAIAGLMGRKLAPPMRVRAPIAAPARTASFTHLVRGELSGEGHATLFAIPTRQGSGMLRTAAETHATGLLPTGGGPSVAGYPIEVVATPEALSGRVLRVTEPLPPLLSITGHSNSGKTRLIEQLTAELSSRGLRVGVLKRASHGPDFDQPGKDSARHAAAGAVCNGVVGKEIAMLRFSHDAPTDPFVWLERMTGGLDVVLLEGFSATPLPRVQIEVSDAAPEIPSLTMASPPLNPPVWTLLRRPETGDLRFPEPLVVQLADLALAPVGVDRDPDLVCH